LKASRQTCQALAARVPCRQGETQKDGKAAWVGGLCRHECLAVAELGRRKPGPEMEEMAQVLKTGYMAE